jgi:hypothetical protein
MNMLGGRAAYFHLDGTGPYDYINQAKFKALNLQNLAVLTSQTPNQAAAPYPWDGTAPPDPCLMFANGTSGLSKTGQYYFACDNRVNGWPGVPRVVYPYALWDTVANTIVYYSTLFNVPGFNSAPYKLGGPMSVVWDINDKLWIVIQRLDLNYDLLRFGVVGNNLNYELTVNLGVNPGVVGTYPTLVISLLEPQIAPIDYVPLPPPFYVMAPVGTKL